MPRKGIEGSKGNRTGREKESKGVKREKSCKRMLFSRREDKGWEGSLRATKFAAVLPWRRLGAEQERGGEVPSVKSFERIKVNTVTPAVAPLGKEGLQAAASIRRFNSEV